MTLLFNSVQFCFFTPSCFFASCRHTSAQCCRPHTLVGSSLSLPAGNRTCFIKANPHVHRVHTVAHVLITVPSRIFRMCGFFSSSTTAFPARTTFCIEMRGLTTFALLNVMHLWSPSLVLNGIVLSPKSLICSHFAGTNFFGVVFSHKLDTWKHRFRHHVARSSRIHGDSDFHPLVFHLHIHFRIRNVTVLHAQLESPLPPFSCPFLLSCRCPFATNFFFLHHFHLCRLSHSNFDLCRIPIFLCLFLCGQPATRDP